MFCLSLRTGSTDISKAVHNSVTWDYFSDKTFYIQHHTPDLTIFQFQRLYKVRNIWFVMKEWIYYKSYFFLLKYWIQNPKYQTQTRYFNDYKCSNKILFLSIKRLQIRGLLAHQMQYQCCSSKIRWIFRTNTEAIQLLFSIWSKRRRIGSIAS